jgi:hypothetical protein
MEYQYVWQTILGQPTEEDEDDIKDSDMMDIDSDTLSVDKVLYDEFITAMIRFLHMMDLGTVEYEQADDSNEGKATFQRTSTSSTGDLRALQPVKAKDFELFQNFVEFATQFLPNTRTDLFEQWIYQFGVCLVTLSNKFPIVSGFYKLASCTLVICNRLDVFKHVSNGAQELFANDVQLKSFICRWTGIMTRKESKCYTANILSTCWLVWSGTKTTCLSVVYT